MKDFDEEVWVLTCAFVSCFDFGDGGDPAVDTVDDKGIIAEMQDRLTRLEDRASKHRQIAKDVMTELDLKEFTAPDFTA